LEKAWAKVNGSYANTISGYPSDAFRCLTGAPTEHFSHRKFNEEIWINIMESCQNNYIISGSSERDKSDGGEKDL
jgi:hypothetical protein